MNDEPTRDTEAIRSDIDNTRRRMDDTMDALGNRLQGRHLVDEILGFFRRSSSNEDGGASSKIKDSASKIKDSAASALGSVVDTVKANPMPALVIGAGIAWMIYETRKAKTYTFEEEDDWSGSDETGLSLDPDPASRSVNYDPDAYVDSPLEYPTQSEVAGATGKVGKIKDKLADKASSVADSARDKMGNAREKVGEIADKAREGLQNVKERAGEMGQRAKEKTREVYQKSRQRVANTADEHPLELGLACVAAGLIVGLALRTPDKVNRVAGPKMERLRRRTREAGREMVEKGRSVADAVTHAAKDEAQAQGLTFDALHDKASAVAGEAGAAASDSARREGLERRPDRGGQPEMNMPASGPACALPDEKPRT